MATEKALAIIPASAQLPEAAGGPLNFDSITRDFYSSIPTNTPEGKAETIRLMQAGAEPLDDVIGKTISVAHIVAHRVMITQKDGPAVPAVRIVLADGQGKAWAAVSDGVKESLRILANFYGTPPWDPALALKVTQVRTRAGRRTYNLTPA